jgi:hypothetical protein
MTKAVSDGEFRGVTALPGPERYSHFVRRVADFEEIWSLHGPSGWVMMGDNAGRKCIPVWPHERYAEVFVRDHWSDAEAKMIELDAWMERWLPGMTRDGLHVAVFPVVGEKQQGVIASPAELRRDLEEELEQYESDDDTVA